jgi:putative peptide zinc metalloprotease protein
LLAWWLLQPGLLRDLGFVTFAVGVFSSLLVNGNPLLQFDGYFVLCDALGLPNLGSRSSLWWGERCARELGGSRAPVVEPAKGERFWLVAYFPLSLTYRIWLSFTVVAWLGGYYFLLGLLAALLMAHSLLLKPLRSLLLDLSRGAGRQGAAWRRRLLWLPLIVLALPLPSATVVQGVVWVPEQATARAGVDGFVAALPVADGQPVQAGQTLVRLDDENLLAEREKLLGQLRAQESQFFGQLRLAPERAQEFATAMARTQSELALTEQRIADLEVRAGRAGRFVMPAQADRLGRLIGRGDVLGYVVDAAAPLVVRVALPHEQAVLVREQTQRINVVLADAPEQTWTAQASGVVSAATLDLPSAALGVNSGGEIVTDPADNKHLRSREPVVLLDVQVADAPSARIGTRAQVRFAHGWAPLAEQLLRRAQQMWLRHVNPAE